MNTYLHDIFVAYAASDKIVAANLVSELQARRASVCWDGLLPAEDSFETAIPAVLAACRVFAVIVSPDTWDGQHYATEELAVAVQLARRSGLVVVPIWTESIPVERRPYGIATKIGIDLSDNKNCLGCVAGRLAETVLRTQLGTAERELSAAVIRQDIPETTRRRQ